MLKKTGFSNIPKGVKDDLRKFIAANNDIEIIKLLIDWGELSTCCGNIVTMSQAQTRIDLAIQDGDF